MKLLALRSVLCISLIVLSPVSDLWGHALSDDTNTKKNKFLEYFRGKATENQFFIGMFTFHFTPSSLETRNWQQNLIGFQYNDFFFGTFENSFYNRSWTAGWARNLERRGVTRNWEMAVGYRLGLATGYEEGQAPFSSISPVIPIVELYSQFLYKEHNGVLAYNDIAYYHNYYKTKHTKQHLF